MTPDRNDLWFLPLGGTGEIGMNLNLYSHDGHWLMADPAFIADRRGRQSSGFRTGGGRHGHLQRPCHPAREELELMYRWVRPAIANPVHGEAERMKTHAAIARIEDIPRAMVGRNGDLFMIRPVPGVRRQVTGTGRLGWEKNILVRVE